MIQRMQPARPGVRLPIARPTVQGPSVFVRRGPSGVAVTSPTVPPTVFVRRSAISQRAAAPVTATRLVNRGLSGLDNGLGFSLKPPSWARKAVAAVAHSVAVNAAQLKKDTTITNVAKIGAGVVGLLAAPIVLPALAAGAGAVGGALASGAGAIGSALATGAGAVGSGALTVAKAALPAIGSGLLAAGKGAVTVAEDVGGGVASGAGDVASFLLSHAKDAASALATVAKSAIQDNTVPSPTPAVSTPGVATAAPPPLITAGGVTAAPEQAGVAGSNPNLLPIAIGVVAVALLAAPKMKRRRTRR